MNGAHLASPIRGELGYAHWPQLGSQIYCPIGNLIWGPLGKEDVGPNFALTVGKFVFSNSGNFRAKQIRQSPGLALNAHSGNDWGPIPVLTEIDLRVTQHNSFIRYADLYCVSSMLLLRSAPYPCTTKGKSFEARVECDRKNPGEQSLRQRKPIPHGNTTTRLRTFRLRHFVYRHFVYRYFVYYDFPC